MAPISPTCPTARLRLESDIRDISDTNDTVGQGKQHMDSSTATPPLPTIMARDTQTSYSTTIVTLTHLHTVIASGSTFVGEWASPETVTSVKAILIETVPSLTETRTTNALRTLTRTQQIITSTWSIHGGELPYFGTTTVTETSTEMLILEPASTSNLTPAKDNADESRQLAMKIGIPISLLVLLALLITLMWWLRRRRKKESVKPKDDKSAELECKHQDNIWTPVSPQAPGEKAELHQDVLPGELESPVAELETPGAELEALTDVQKSLDAKISATLPFNELHHGTSRSHIGEDRQTNGNDSSVTNLRVEKNKKASVS